MSWDSSLTVDVTGTRGKENRLELHTSWSKGLSEILIIDIPGLIETLEIRIYELKILR